MKTRKKFDRERLREILESYDGNLRMFETLRSNSYEHALAAHSLEELDMLYSKIFAPGVSLKDTAKSCPRWPDGTKRAGKRPKASLLENIHDRFMAERGLNALTVEAERADAYGRAVRALPVEGQLKVLEKKYQAEVKSQENGGPITKEGWEQIERDLKLI
jgi:hypothetical protein